VSVGDDSLVQCIHELRQKLGDDGRRLIKTVSRRGYLLDATVSLQAPQSVSNGSAPVPTDGLAKPATRLDVLHRALRGTIPAHKSHMWGAATAGLVCVALGIIYLIGAPLLITNPRHVSVAKNIAAEQYLRPTFRDCGNCPEMVAVPAGEFMMGSPADEPRRQWEEGFPRRVVIKKPFAIGRFEVTVDQFSAFVAETEVTAGNQCTTIVGDNGNPGSSFVLGPPEGSFRQPGYAVTGTHPVACISWSDAQAYAAWLARRSGRRYRLPTEAEWEYAARAGTQTQYSFGNDKAGLCDHGRFADSGTPFPWRSGCGRDTASPIPVGQLMPNPWGIFDMHGNVWERVEDCWTENTSEIPTDGSAFWPSEGSCRAGVMRGGSWANPPQLLRSAARRRVPMSAHDSHVGFRVALSLGE